MKQLQKLFLSIMLIATVCLLVPSSANAQIIKKYTWNGFVYTKDDVPWKDGDINILSYKGKKKNLIIPSEIKGLKVAYVHSLGKSKTLESVHISDDVEVIGGVLSKCPNLKKVTISKTNPDYMIKNKMLLSKDGKTLVGCPGAVKNPKIPDSVTVIGHSAFSGMNIKKITIGKNVTQIEHCAFKNCKKLSNVNFNKKLKIIDGEAFYGCKALKEIKLPDSVIQLSDYIFAECTKLETLKIGKNLKYIGFGNLTACKSLRSLYIYSKNCLIEEGADTLLDSIPNQKNVTVYGKKGSTIQKEAEKYSQIKFQVIK